MSVWEGRTLVTRVVLVRHGESSFNVERRIQGHCDESTLTETGRATARQVVTALQGLPIDAMYASPLKRAKETADIICSGLAEFGAPPRLTTSDLLKEISLPLWEGVLFQDVETQFPDDYRAWREAPHELCMKIAGPGGSEDFFPVLAVFEQARAVWRELLEPHRGGTIVLVAHSGIIRALVSTALGIAPRCYQHFQVVNCGVSILNMADEPDQSNQLEGFNLTNHLGDRLPKLKSSHQGPRLLLVRHGETDWNRDKRFQGQIDVPLNTTGQEQAQRVAEFLQEVALDFAVSSPLARPKATAEAILKYHPDIPLALYDGLQEISHGLWEGKLDGEVEQLYPGLLAQWKTHPETVQMPEGENLQQVWERVNLTWRTIVKSAPTTPQAPTGLVSAHDAVNKAILSQVFDLGPEAFWCFKQGNGAVSVIDYPDGPTGHPVLQAMNITTHLGGGILDTTAAGAL